VDEGLNPNFYSVEKRMLKANPNPAVTIAMPFFNSAATLELCIQSLLNQSCADFELLLCDDGSYDQSLAIARSFSDQRLVCWSDGRRLGLLTRLNECIDRTRGPYMGRMDADDIAYPDRLAQKMVFLVDHQEVGRRGGSAMVFGKYGARSGALVRRRTTEKSSPHLLWDFPYCIPPGWVGSSGFAIGVTMRALG
jgi:glycosyltransferase involved in cell wall biosynthesis